MVKKKWSFEWFLSHTITLIQNYMVSINLKQKLLILNFNWIFCFVFISLILNLISFDWTCIEVRIYHIWIHQFFKFRLFCGIFDAIGFRPELHFGFQQWLLCWGHKSQRNLVHRFAHLINHQVTIFQMNQS